MKKLDEFIPSLARAVPEFTPDRTDVEDQLPYLVSHDLISFTMGLDPDRNTELVDRIFVFWERLFESPDKELEMLLRDIAWTIAEQSNFHRFRLFLGNKLRKFVRESPAGSVLDS